MSTQPTRPGKLTPSFVPTRRKRRQRKSLDDRPVLEANAAGIDIGAREIFVAVPPDRDEHPVRVFGTFTEDLQRLGEWLVTCRVTTAAMESTGVYWIPLYDLLEARGVTPCLVNARHMKKRARSTDRLARMSVAAISAHGGAPAPRLSA